MSEIPSEWKLSAIKQRFTIPEALVFYMSQNPPSPEVYNKLIKCCKYFWLKNPVITINSLYRFFDGKYWEAEKINGFREIQKFKIENLNEKLWIHWNLVIQSEHDQFLASPLIPKIFRCQLSHLDIANQILTFDEFQKFTSSGSLTWLVLEVVLVKNVDGSIVPIEKLIELLPKLQKFDYLNLPGDNGLQTITPETAANLNAIPHFPKIQNFTMDEVPESFDYEVFFGTPKVRN